MGGFSIPDTILGLISFSISNHQNDVGRTGFLGCFSKWLTSQSNLLPKQGCLMYNRKIASTMQ